MRDRCACVLVAGVLAATVVPPATAQPQAGPSAGGRQRGVLFLAIEDFTRPYVRLMFESFSRALLEAPDAPAVYFESLDAPRFERKEYSGQLREWLRRKYAGVRIDLVVPVSDFALAFLADARGEPWPEAQVLYIESGSITVDTARQLPRAGGILMGDHYVEMMRVIAAILPGTRRLALLKGGSALEASRWLGFDERVRMAGLEPFDLVDLSIEDALSQVARLPAQTALLILAPAVDAMGHVLTPDQVCAVIASKANLPVFTPAVHDLGCGAVGGRVRDWSAIGGQLGEEALARLNAPSTAVVEMPLSRQTTLVFDDRQLRRWGVPEARLPAGAAVRFREPNLWRDNRGLVLITIAVTLLQSLLIAGLVFEHRRRRRAEIESRRHLAAMAHLDRRAAMGELATSLAHELNQPLNAILQNAGVAQMLLTSTAVPPALDEMAEIISDIRKDDIRASEVIRRMRGLLQKRELESRPVDLNEVAAETIAIAHHDALSRGIEVSLEQGDSLPVIQGDRVHLQQVLLNLLMNAMDAVAALPPERRRVRVSVRHDQGEVRLSVEDTGTGIPADRLGKIFEPFYTTKSEGTGMGMGLAIARNIVEAHAGRVGAENNPGGGATVWFTLPAPDLTKGL
jgi:signal transduction histidine kinase